MHDVGIRFSSPQPPPQERPSLGLLLFCQVLPPKLSICSTGHTHRSRAVCHRTQMPSCGRDSFSSIRLFLGKTFRQSKENSPGTAFGPALWLTLCLCVSSGSRSDLAGLDTAFPEVCLSVSLKGYLRFYFDFVKWLWTSREAWLVFWGCFSH